MTDFSNFVPTSELRGDGDGKAHELSADIRHTEQIVFNSEWNRLGTAIKDNGLSERQFFTQMQRSRRRKTIEDVLSSKTRTYVEKFQNFRVRDERPMLEVICKRESLEKFLQPG
jgi:hypothetical protein